MTTRLTMTLTSLLAVGGCANLDAERAYRNIILGATPTATLDRLLPAPATRTTVGYTSGRQERWPEVDTVVIVLGRIDGHADAKCLLTLTRDKMGQVGRTRVALTADLLGRSNSIGTPGPVGRLTRTLQRLGEYQHKAKVDRAHQLVAATVIRLLESLPDVHPPQAEYQRLDEALARIPANGAVTITNQTPDGYHIEYRAAGSLP